MGVSEELKLLRDDLKAEHHRRFFKTGKGEYGEGDNFLGVGVPQIRKLAAKHYKDTGLEEIQELMSSKYHEVRMVALIILNKQYERAKEAKTYDEIYNLYISNTQYINNWDLVDISAPNIVGTHLLNKDRALLYTFANSTDLWKQRISILATYTFIKRNQFDDTIRISEILLNNSHDLIQKAVGWMLREMGKMDTKPLYRFLDKYSKVMPRTMLRYSLEKVPHEKRSEYMKK